MQKGGKASNANRLSKTFLYWEACTLGMDLSTPSILHAPAHCSSALILPKNFRGIRTNLAQLPAFNGPSRAYYTMSVRQKDANCG
jgi:hypothetical protein